ncbi:uncharacterized protein LOC143174707 [Nomia melanderi]|uniref:uncharacterized protein LOC143174707 n=1 Tax=Nomia melanderi TaxID=2448451 RepID=UPI003FCCB719
MRGTFLFGIVLLILLVLLQQPVESKKVIIHVPYRVKKMEHTHTIYKLIPHYEHKHHDHHDHHDHHEKEDLEDDDKYDI